MTQRWLGPVTSSARTRVRTSSRFQPPVEVPGQYVHERERPLGLLVTIRARKFRDQCTEGMAQRIAAKREHQPLPEGQRRCRRRKYSADAGRCSNGMT